MQSSAGKRLGFRKSRNGCLRCKRRRVKCDEEVPCSACVRHHAPCSLETPDPVTSGASDTSHPGGGPTRDSNASVPTTTTTTTITTTTTDPSILSFVDSMDEPECWIANAELIFHYCNVSSRVFSLTDELATIFQVNIPHEAIAYPFLLRLIMAFSAFHLAQLHPDKETHYLLLANNHQSRAVRALREALAQPITPENCHALFGASILLAITKFASFASYRDDHLHECGAPIHHLVETFYMVHGMSAILKSSEDHVRTGPLRSLFGITYQIPPPASICAALVSLAEHVADVRARLSLEDFDFESDVGSTGGGDVGPVVLSAVERLHECIVEDTTFPRQRPPAAEIRALFAWPSLVARDFLDLAKAGHPAAMVILAHYACIVHWASPRYWFFQGWGTALIDSIAKTLSGSRWAPMIDWPASIIAAPP